MRAMASQIPSLTIVYSTVYLDADQRKHQSSASLAFVRGIHLSPVNSPYKRASNVENVSIWWRHHGSRITMSIPWRSDVLVPCVTRQSVAMWYWQLTLRVKQVLIFHEEVYNVTGSSDRPPHFDQQRFTSNGCDWNFPASDLNALYGYWVILFSM